MENNREVTTTLQNILDLINCAESYGFGDDIFYDAMFSIIKPLSEEEIESYAKTFLTGEMIYMGYSQEDYDSAIETLIELNNKYGK